VQRRDFIKCAAGAAAAVALPAIGQPAAPLRIVVPFSAGGATDRTTRALARELSALRGQTVIVDNRAGANTIIGAQAVANAPPDGLTLLMATDSTLSINPLLYRSLPYDPARDFALVSLVARIPSQLMLHPSVPANTVDEFLALLRAKPGALNYGSFGPGSTPHLSTVAFMSRTGTTMTHIPYKGVAECTTALLAGDIQVLIASISGPLQHVRAGRVKPLVALSDKRQPLLPQVPAAGETVLGDFRSSAWYGLVAPARTPKAALQALEADVAKVLSNPAFVQQELIDQALETLEPGARAFAAVLERDRKHYAEVIKTSGVQLSN
jgi:tripartite-type tricarboxylate transporter receptor subunit TctC